jgi:hypothetical protein
MELEIIMISKPGTERQVPYDLVRVESKKVDHTACKRMNVVLYENGKMRPDETILGIGKGELWKR